MENWIAEVRGRMYVERITAVEVAKHLDVCPAYISAIFNGKRKPKRAEERIRRAIEEIKEKRKLSEGSESLGNA